MSNKVERWMEVCELAAKEQDPRKLMELTNEIIRLIDEGQKNGRPANAVSAANGVPASTSVIETAT